MYTCVITLYGKLNFGTAPPPGLPPGLSSRAANSTHPSAHNLSSLLDYLSWSLGPKWPAMNSAAQNDPRTLAYPGPAMPLRTPLKHTRIQHPQLESPDTPPFAPVPSLSREDTAAASMLMSPPPEETLRVRPGLNNPTVLSLVDNLLP